MAQTRALTKIARRLTAFALRGPELDINYLDINYLNVIDATWPGQPFDP